MSTLRVDNIKSRTGTTVTIPDSQNLAVTGALTVTGSQSFSAGATLALQGENINTGLRGDILYYGANGQIAKLNIGAAGSVLQSDGSDVSWGNLGSATNVYYVSTNGVDAAGRGGSIDTAWASVKYACSNIATPTASNPAVIFIKAGTYEEVNLPIVVPPWTTIVGDNLRATIIKPGTGLDSSGSVLNTRSTLFRCSNGVIIQDLVLDGMEGYVPGTPAYAPTQAVGTYFALNAASPITDKSPYIYNVTSFGDGATGAYIDGGLHNTGNRSMLFHTYTCLHNDGLGIWVDDNANAEIISGFTYYCWIGFAATGGSKIRSLNSSNSYGEYGVYSAGFDSSENPNTGSVVGTMLTYTGVLGTDFQLGEVITGGTSGATAYVANFQAEPKVIYIVGKVGTFQPNEVVTGSSSGATATLEAANVETNQSGRILVTSFATAPTPGDSLQFATTDGNAYQIQTVSTVTANGVDYDVLVFSTSRATPVPSGTSLNVRKEFSLIRLTGHDFLQIGTGDSASTNWPNNPTQSSVQADQIVTNSTDPGRVYYVATDDLGNFYVGDYFKVDQATGQVTLDASAFDLTGLQSIRLGSLGGLIGASVNEFSTDGGLTQNSDTKVPTQQAVKTYVDNLSSVAGNFTVGGNLTVSGTTTTINTQNLIVEDKNITLGSGAADDTVANGGGITLASGDGNKTLTWTDATNGVNYWSLTGGYLQTTNGIDAASILKEGANIVNDKLSNQPNISVESGMVHHFTTQETTTSTPNIRYNTTTSLSDVMNVGEAISVVIITTAAAAAYSAQLNIDGSGVTENWIGGSAPATGGSSGLDVYTYTIIRKASTGTPSNDYSVLASLSKTS